MKNGKKRIWYLIPIFVFVVFSTPLTQTHEASCDNCVCLKQEPQYTKGDTNQVFLEGEKKKVKFEYSLDLINWIPAGKIAVIDSSGPIGPLNHNTKYYYRAIRTDLNPNCISDTVFSIQDAQPPEVEIRNSQTGPSCVDSSVFQIPFVAWDNVSGAVDEAQLYYRIVPAADWKSAGFANLDSLMPAISPENPVSGSFVFQAPQDGQYEFFIIAKDTARDASARPGTPLTGRDGNWGAAPSADTKPLDSMLVDTTEPFSEIDSLKLGKIQKFAAFNVPYSANDRSSQTLDVSGIDSVVLFYRFESEENFKRFAAHNFSQEVEVDSFFKFKADSRDGIYFFYTKAYDHCGNIQSKIKIDSTEVTSISRVVNVTPNPNSFNFKSQVPTITIEFDRTVKPRTSWSEAIKIVNRYNYPDTVVACNFPDTTVEISEVMCTPAAGTQSAGHYVIKIDPFALSSTDASQAEINQFFDTNTFEFFTYMEQGEAGQIQTSDLTLQVDSGHPQQDVVFKFQDLASLDCSFEDFDDQNQECSTITAFIDEQGGTTAGIPGDLTLRHSFADNKYPRIFRKEPVGCLPGEAPEILDNTGQKMKAHFDDLTGDFCVLAQLTVSEFKLSTFPNPFGAGENKLTKINFKLDGAFTDVSLRIYDMFGNLVKNFTEYPNFQSGYNEVVWDGKNDLNEKVANGGYICVLIVDGNKDLHKIAIKR